MCLYEKYTVQKSTTEMKIGTVKAQDQVTGEIEHHTRAEHMFNWKFAAEIRS